MHGLSRNVWEHAPPANFKNITGLNLIVAHSKGFSAHILPHPQVFLNEKGYLTVLYSNPRQPHGEPLCGGGYHAQLQKFHWQYTFVGSSSHKHLLLLLLLLFIYLWKVIRALGVKVYFLIALLCVSTALLSTTTGASYFQR